MSQEENQEPTNQAVEIEDLSIEELVKLVEGGNGGIQKLGSRRLILQGDVNY